MEYGLHIGEVHEGYLGRGLSLGSFQISVPALKRQIVLHLEEPKTLSLGLKGPGALGLRVAKCLK